MIRDSRRLIVGSAGSANSFGTIQSVRDRYGDKVFVIATDTERRELVAASVLADAFVQMPLARAPEFPEALAELAMSYPDSCYLPMHDEEIGVVVRLAAEGRLAHSLKLIAPPYDVVHLCSDKWQMHRWLRAKGLPSPDTALATPAALETMRRPVILKPREGTGGWDFRSIQETAELADVDPSQWLIQELLQEPQVALDVFLSRTTSAFRCICREAVQRKVGVPTKIRIFNDAALASIAERLARELPLFGAFIFQAMRDAAGHWQIHDVNPRVGGGTRMCAAVGLDFAAANLADHWGEPTDAMLQPLAGEHYVVRQYADYVTSRP